MDGTAIAQEISVEHCVAFSPPGSRSDLWIRVRAATDGYGRRDMPGSRHRVQRSDLSWRDFPPSPIFRLVDHRSRNHLGLEKDTPDPRPVHPPGPGRIIAGREVGGLNYRYERRAA